jgi:hypothetical protein
LSIKVSELVRQKVFASHAQKSVARSLADYAADDGSKAFPSVDTLAGDAQLSDRTVQSALKGLRKSGIIVVMKQGGGRNLSTQYRLNLAAIAKLPDAHLQKEKGEAPSPFQTRKGENGAEKGEAPSPDPSLSVKKDKQPDLQNLSPPPAHSAPTERGARAPADLNSEIWKAGLALLTANGVATERARSILGQWCKRANSPDLKEQLAGAIRHAVEIGTGDPISYVAAAMKDIAPLAPDPQTLTAKEWGVRARVVIERREWPSDFGPRPDSGKCLMPAELISPELIEAIAQRRAA